MALCVCLSGLRKSWVQFEKRANQNPDIGNCSAPTFTEIKDPPSLKEKKKRGRAGHREWCCCCELLRRINMYVCNVKVQQVTLTSSTTPKIKKGLPLFLFLLLKNLPEHKLETPGTSLTSWRAQLRRSTCCHFVLTASYRWWFGSAFAEMHLQCFISSPMI